MTPSVVLANGNIGDNRSTSVSLPLLQPPSTVPPNTPDTLSGRNESPAHCGLCTLLGPIQKLYELASGV